MLTKAQLLMAADLMNEAASTMLMAQDVRQPLPDELLGTVALFRQAVAEAEEDVSIHKLEDGSPDKRPEVDEELVAYLGMSAELFQTIFDHTDNLNIKQACGRAMNMAMRLGEEHRSMYIPYSEMVKNLFAKMDSETLEVLHAAVGISGEAGELLDAIKKHWAYNRPLDVPNVLEELGDLVFYIQAMMNMFGWTWADLRMSNRMKLAKRYPDGVYSDKHAQARLDKEGETK